MRYLWRAVDRKGEVLESFVTKTRDKPAALKFIKKAMKRHGGAKPGAVVLAHAPWWVATCETELARRGAIGRQLVRGYGLRGGIPWFFSSRLSSFSAACLLRRFCTSTSRTSPSSSTARRTSG